MPQFAKLAIVTALFGTVCPVPALAQNTPTEVPPVIDVHFHALLESPPGMPPACPNQSQFLASDWIDGPEG